MASTDNAWRRCPNSALTLSKQCAVQTMRWRCCQNNRSRCPSSQAGHLEEGGLSGHLLSLSGSLNLNKLSQSSLPVCCSCRRVVESQDIFLYTCLYMSACISTHVCADALVCTATHVVCSSIPVCISVYRACNSMQVCTGNTCIQYFVSDRTGDMIYCRHGVPRGCARRHMVIWDIFRSSH